MKKPSDLDQVEVANILYRDKFDSIWTYCPDCGIEIELGWELQPYNYRCTDCDCLFRVDAKTEIEDYKK